MTRQEFISLKAEQIIYNNTDNKIVIVKSSFIDSEKVKDLDNLKCLEFFMQKTEVNVPVQEYEKWNIFNHETFMDDLSQGLMNKLLLKKIMILESKLKNASIALK